MLLGDGDAAAVVQAAAADAVAAAAVADVGDEAIGNAAILPNIAAAAGNLVAENEGNSRGCPLYAKYYDKTYPHSNQASQAKPA